MLARGLHAKLGEASPGRPADDADRMPALKRTHGYWLSSLLALVWADMGICSASGGNPAQNVNENKGLRYGAGANNAGVQ